MAVVLVLLVMFSFPAATVPAGPQAEVAAPMVHSNGNSLDIGTAGNSSLSLSVPGNNVTTSPVSTNSNWTATGKLVSRALADLNIPTEAKLPPNFVYGPLKTDGSYGPTYGSGPAPLGLGSYGVYNNSGILSNYTYSTKSFEGSVTINNASELYLSSDNPTSYSIQLNAVLNNVTLFGKIGYQFWTQNVAFYNASSHSLTFIDNIWNLSSPTALINGNEFHNYTGTPVPGFYYYKIGPTITVSYPFSLNLYLNSTEIGGYNTVFFNYSLSGNNVKYPSGSYDRVEFNSSSPSSPSGSSPALFEVSGSRLTDTNFIPMDAELIFGGPGGGSTANFQNISGSMNLNFYNGTHYSPVRSAYSVGSETGETSLGISEYYQGTTAYLSPGPSFVRALWGISNSPGYITVSGKLDPTNAFIFFSNSARMDNATAQWAPVPANGDFSYRLQNGTYSMEALLSYHDPAYFNGLAEKGGSTAISPVDLKTNLSKGLYTPLYASDNSQLASISKGGTGTAANPYIIPGPDYANSTIHGLSSHIMGVFSQANDYLFPSFYGILIDNTTAHAAFTGFSSGTWNSAFQIQYPAKMERAIETIYGGVMSNDLAMAFYDSSNIVLNNSAISGWFPSLDYYGYTHSNIPTIASLIFWNTTDSLIAGNVVSSQGSGILLYGTNGYSMGDYVWNNTFRNARIQPIGGYFSGAPIGLTVASSGNTVYNNIFNTTIPVVSLSGPGQNLYTGSWANYTNHFNVSKEPSSAYKEVLGVNLTGNILGLNYQGGNFYYDYFGNGSQRYNGSGVGFAFNGQSALNGSISYTYDYAPLAIPAETTSVSAANLPSTQNTYFDINNAIYEISPKGNTELYLPNGTYQLLGFGLSNKYVQYLPATYIGPLALSNGGFAVSGPMVNISLNYTTYYNLTVQENGLPNGTLWGFTVPQAQIGYTLTSANQSLFVEAGSFDVLPQSVDGFAANSIFGALTGPATATIHYYNISGYNHTGNYSVIFTESGLPKNTTWGIDLNGNAYTSNSSSFELVEVPPGYYTFSVISINGYASLGSGTFIVNSGNASVSIVFSRSPSIIGDLAYLGLGALIGGVVVGSAWYFRRKTH